MSKTARALLGLVLGYPTGAAIGGALVSALSGNPHDRGLEMVMTAAFVTGPAGALAGCILARPWRRQ